MKTRYYGPHNTGRFYDLKKGWSWTLFFFATSFGIPFFFRRMYPYAFSMIALSLIGVIFAKEPVIEMLVGFAQLFANLFFAIKGNEITRNYLLDRGWVPETEKQWSDRMRGV